MPSRRAIIVAALAAGLLVTGRAAAQEREHAHGDEGHVHAHGGFPEYVDLFFTHHAYLERKVHPRFDAVVAEAGNQYSESLEFVWQFNRWLGAEVEAALIQSDPDLGEGVSGFGDLEVAPMVALVQDPARLLIVTARSGFVLPTGDEDEGLGVDGWGWEPGLLIWKGLGAEGRGALQAEIGYGRTFANEGVDEEELAFNLGYSYWTHSNWIPVAEIHAVERLGEHEEGALADRQLSGTLGFRYAFANGQQWGAAVQLPLLGDTESYDWRVVIGGIIHLQ
jgi:hypothetical protein